MTFVPKSSLTVSALFIALLRLCYTVKGGPNASINVLICNVKSQAEGDPFWSSVTYVLFDLMNVTPSQQGFDYSTTSPYSTTVAYGRTTCSCDLSNNDSTNCLVSAKETLKTNCGGWLGCQMELVDCSMRFEYYYFEARLARRAINSMVVALSAPLIIVSLCLDCEGGACVRLASCWVNSLPRQWFWGIELSNGVCFNLLCFNSFFLALPSYSRNWFVSYNLCNAGSAGLCFLCTDLFSFRVQIVIFNVVVIELPRLTFMCSTNHNMDNI